MIIQKDIAYQKILTFLSKDWLNKFKTTHLKLEIKYLVLEMNLITKIYIKFLFQQDLMTSEQMDDLIDAFKSKLLQFTTSESIKMTLNEENVVRRIASNLVIIEKSLKTAHTVLSFEYLNYFIDKT